MPGKPLEIVSFGSLEAKVMDVVWGLDKPSTGMEVMEQCLYTARAKGLDPASFATIATVLRRLAQKGVLKVEKKKSRTPIYTPTIGREEMFAKIMDNVSYVLLGVSLQELFSLLSGEQEPENEGQFSPQALRNALEKLA